MRLKIFVMFCSCVLTAGSVLQTTRSSTSGSILAPPLKFAAKMSPDQNQARLVNAYAALPLAFEINDGHTDDQVKALARGRGHTMFLTRVGETVFVLQKLRGLQRDVVRMNLVGGNPTPRVEGLDELPGKANYFIGNDPKKWRTNVPTYARVKVRDVYPGVDVVYYGKQQQLEHDFMVAPGADPDSIRIGFDGAEKLSLDREGNLVLGLKEGQLRFQKPALYQDVAGVRKEIAGGYILRERGKVGFEVSAYDRREPLVIDPVLVYSTYLGGSGSDGGVSIAVDTAGSAYLTGSTPSTNFPATPGTFRTTSAGGFDAFVTKLNATGTALVYSTYLGGNQEDVGSGIAVDSVGNAYVTGDTRSANFPATFGAAQTTIHGGADVFIAKLSPTGTGLVYSTYLGGTGGAEENARGIAVDSTGNAYVTGMTGTLNFPTTPGAFQTTPGGGIIFDAFVTKLNPTGSAFAYSTYLGGSGADLSNAIDVDSLGNAYVTGETRSTNFPTTAGAFRTASANGDDAFVTKLNVIGSALVYSTYLGGNNLDASGGIAVDSQSNAFVTGITFSTNFPVTPGALQTTKGSGSDAFVSEVNPAGSGLVYSTYLGGNGHDGGGGGFFVGGGGIALDSMGSAYVTGFTSSTNFPTTPGAFQTASGGGVDGFVTKLNATGSALVYSTYLGGSGFDSGSGIAVDGAGNAYVAGATASSNFPTTPGAFQTASGGNGDGFVAKIQSGTIAGYEIVSNRVVVPASGSAIVTATCSIGKKVLGGGFSIETPNVVKVFSSEPPDDHGWSAAAQNTDPNNARQVTSVAICASPSAVPGHEIVSTQLFLPASTSANVNAACSIGKKVLGGGFSIETPDFVRLSSSGPSDGLGNLSDHNWNVIAQNADPNNARQVTSSAVCASPTLLAGYEIVTNQVTLPAAGFGAVNVTCSTGKKVLGGGFALGHSLFVKLFHELPSDGQSNLSDRAWDVFAQNTDPNNSWPAFVSAVCASATP